MKSEFTYKIHLRKAFEGKADEAPQSADEAFRLRDRVSDPFEKRVIPIETFVSRTAALVHPLDGGARISSERSIETSSLGARILSLRFNDQTFEVRDLRPDRYANVLSAHYDNRMFLESASASVPQFAKAVADQWPVLREAFPDMLRRLEDRLRQTCHEIMAYERRREMGNEHRRTRNRPDLDGWIPKGVK